MHDPQPALIARDHTILGVCEALGEDFGFNPVILRVAFAVPLIFSPTGVLALYLTLGAVVLVSRLLSPNPRRRRKAAPAGAEAAQAEPAPVQPQVPLDEDHRHPLPLAA